jgi:ferredoxin-type protein NapH
MSGKLHFPIPAMIICGPIYRGEISFMIILFVSTILLSGPAWCSQICYFGALDGIAAKGKKTKTISHLWRYRLMGLIIIIGITFFMKIIVISIEPAIIITSVYGIGGLIIIFFLSRKKKLMTHCLCYCPIGTIVSIGKYLSPFRMNIKHDCSQCMQCASSCKYQALTSKDIKELKPGISCTYCGDCLVSCQSSSIQYKLWKFSPKTARLIYLCITISIHSTCMVLARI